MSFESMEKCADTLKELTDNKIVRSCAATVKSSFVGAFWGNLLIPFAPLPVTMTVCGAVTLTFLVKKLKQEGLIQ